MSDLQPKGCWLVIHSLPLQPHVQMGGRKGYKRLTHRSTFQSVYVRPLQSAQALKERDPELDQTSSTRYPVRGRQEEGHRMRACHT